MPQRVAPLIALALALAGLASCRPGADLAADRAALLRLHELQREAHLSKRAPLLTQVFADTFRDVARGRVAMPSREESTARMQAYLDRSTFQAWDDIAPPIIRVSGDGSMAYVIVQKRVILTTPDSIGRAVVEHTEFAWLETYEKTGGEWRLTAVASTDRPGEASVELSAVAFPGLARTPGAREAALDDRHVARGDRP